MSSKKFNIYLCPPLVYFLRLSDAKSYIVLDGAGACGYLLAAGHRTPPAHRGLFGGKPVGVKENLSEPSIAGSSNGADAPRRPEIR